MFFLLMTTGLLSLQTPSKEIKLEVEIPKTRHEKEIGLSQKKSLPLKKGMLFEFKKEDVYAFTMQETQVPLTLFFFNKDKELIDIETFEAFDPELIYTKPNCQYVLEASPKLLEKNDFPLYLTKMD